MRRWGAGAAKLPGLEPRTSAEDWPSGSRRQSRKLFSRKGGAGSNPASSALLRGKSLPAGRQVAPTAT